ncbi:hypothetical protein HED54_15980 [Ochrobactrum anthropi ATCC 49188]|nr:hypothetical protein [Brucella anthropi ATCC 49188]
MIERGAHAVAQFGKPTSRRGLLSKVVELVAEILRTSHAIATELGNVALQLTERGPSLFAGPLAWSRSWRRS